ncbi:MAG: biotin--[acetyl-CoA-carboxylase] ligase [Crocinitomicaceae bacterium]|nr:biotin--[acetyl-CoA-carboxylase] ligase [Crocinitomicaceae bacterium]
MRISVEEIEPVNMHYKQLSHIVNRFPSLQSTNATAMQLLDSQKPAQGTVIIADNQTAGKGQRGNTWISEAGKNLTFSIIIYPRIAAEKMFFLNMATSLAVRDALQIFLTDVKIKWPNDIFCSNRKIGGILIENQVRNNIIQASVAGIGINCNQSEFKQLQPTPTSVLLQTGKEIDLNEVFERIYDALDFMIDLLLAHNYALISKKYHEQLYGLNEEKLFRDEAGVFKGVITGVDPYGKLKVRVEEKIVHYDLKEIALMHAED